MPPLLLSNANGGRHANMIGMSGIFEACCLLAARRSRTCFLTSALPYRQDVRRISSAGTDNSQSSTSSGLPSISLSSRVPDLVGRTPSISPTPDMASALTLIRQQPSHYVIASLLGQRYLLAPRDLLTVPRVKNVAVGDILKLDAIHEVGSRDFTIRGDPCLPADTVSVRVTVAEHTKGEMEVIVKKKRRKGYKRTVKHKQTYTRLRIGDIAIGSGAT